MTLTYENIIEKNIINNILDEQWQDISRHHAPNHDRAYLEYYDKISVLTSELDNILNQREQDICVKLSKSDHPINVDQYLIDIIGIGFLLHTPSLFTEITPLHPRDRGFYYIMVDLVEELIKDIDIHRYLNDLYNYAKDAQRRNEQQDLDEYKRRKIFTISELAIKIKRGLANNNPDIENKKTISIHTGNIMQRFAKFYFNNIFSFTIQWKPIPNTAPYQEFYPDPIFSQDTQASNIHNFVKRLIDMTNSHFVNEFARKSQTQAVRDEQRGVRVHPNINRVEEARADRQKIPTSPIVIRPKTQSKNATDSRGVLARRGLNQARREDTRAMERARRRLGFGRGGTRRKKKIKRSIRKKKKRTKYNSKKN